MYLIINAPTKLCLINLSLTSETIDPSSNSSPSKVAFKTNLGCLHLTNYYPMRFEVLEVEG